MKINNVLFTILMSILVILGFLALLSLGFYAVGQIEYFVFNSDTASFIYLIKGLVGLAIAVGIPIGISVSVEMDDIY